MRKRAKEDETAVLKTSGKPFKLRRMSLLVTKGPDLGTRYPVEGDLFVIGKATDCHLVLEDPAISRTHLQIEKTGDTYSIRDLGSTNGTMVDGTQIKEAFLSPGSTITIGNLEVLFQPVYTTSGIDLKECNAFGSLIAASVSMKSIMGLMKKAATAGTTVLLQGETGVGKSALAKVIHEEGPRHQNPFVVFDSGSVPSTLIESELFGAEKGAFTGAVVSRPGACEQAQGGTLFLDEIGELPLDLQTKLLRVLEEREVRRLGSTKSTSLDVQIVAASKVDLAEAMERGRFRNDLYYRIAVVCVQVPPLRERPEDIPLLCDRFLSEVGSPLTWDELPHTVKTQFKRYSWPGNLRELRNVLERMQCVGPNNFTDMRSNGLGDLNPLPLSLNMNGPFKEAKEELIDSFEREYLERLLERSGGRIAPAAREAGLNRQYFYDLLKKHGLHGSKQ